MTVLKSSTIKINSPTIFDKNMCSQVSWNFFAGRHSPVFAPRRIPSGFPPVSDRVPSSSSPDNLETEKGKLRMPQKLWAKISI